MPNSEQVLAATFVEPRGMIRSVVAATAGREVLGAVGAMSAERAAAAVRGASVEKGKIAGVLQVSFEDGSAWAFDVPKVHLKGAREIAGELAD